MRQLRMAVCAACDRPDKAKDWIFELEAAGSKDIEYYASSKTDRMRTLDAKLAEALSKVIKGEPARKLAVEAQKKALKYDMLAGRQILYLVCHEFARDEARTDHIAYGNLEHISYNGSEIGLEAFVNTWDHLLLTFKTQPTEAHLYSALLTRLEKVPGLSDTITYLKRLDYGHQDKTYDYLMQAARKLIIQKREEKQQKDLLKLYRGGSNDMALPATPAEKAKMPCFAIRDGKECAKGKSCPYSHDPKVIREAKEKKEKANAKGKGKGKDGGKSKDKGKDGGKGKGKDKGGKGKKICAAFNSNVGCMRGSACRDLHETPAMAAAPAVPPPPAAPAAEGGRRQ